MMHRLLQHNPTQTPRTNPTRKSNLYQIFLNEEIQQVLLAPHSSRNSSEFEDFQDLSLSDWCGVVNQRFSERKTIKWKANLDKYLLASPLSKTGLDKIS
ncbi:hypothetical protein RchiOBHm_Chr5g0070421 [Rosa chinensis]|uniref:Uncharacterized protein n=1 Tax=Rosa chinensis TaxID=74649 RepID=A0A2P6QK69_ROSCH|nr:hypothetical protein RchiOBHm_Chr5g0070421 [Rosa chinensis]